MNLTQIKTHLQDKTGRAYWRSLNELAGKPGFQGWVNQEFGSGLTEGLDAGSRRQVLKLMAASFGLAGLVACRRPEEHILPVARGVEDVIPGKPVFYNTAYVTRGAATGVTVEVHDGRPTKIEGNPNHPASKGGATAQAQASVLGVYDPDRVRAVTKDGKKSDGGWADWDKFAAGQFAEAKVGKGAGLRFLSERTSSPTLLSLKAQALKRYPEAKWAEYDAVDAGNAISGAEMAFGERLQPHYDLSAADVVVFLDFDALCLDTPSVLAAKQFSARRRVNKPGDEMNRLYVAESHFSVTGGMADHRIRIKAGEVGQLASDLATEVGAQQTLKVLKGGATEKWVASLARDLKAHAGKSVVAAGPRQPAAVHALAYLINQSLGNIGTTVTFTRPVFEPAQSLAELTQEMANGQVSTLLILGGNPAYTAPADLKFTAALKKVANSVYLGAGEWDETAAAVNWALPGAHYLEAWGDARALDGTASIQQPMILPLYDGRSAIELVAQATGGDGKFGKGYELVRGYWLAALGAEGERAWRKALHDGVVAGSAYAAVKTGAAKAVAAPAAASGLEVVFLASASADDGRFNNNAWMQEAPDPMTKITWDNAALLSAKTAQELGVAKDGDMITVTTKGGSLEVAAVVAPGQADGSIGLTLGYGRSVTGRVGAGTGFNATQVRTSDGWSFGGATAAKAGKHYELVTTQEYHRMEEPADLQGKMRPVVRETTAAKFKEDPKVIAEMVHLPEMFDLQGTHDYSKGYQWGMTIDLNACTGCNACLVACQAENNIPVVGKDQVRRGREMHWIRLDRYYTGPAEDPQAVMQPIGCQQCEAAPCENVCPVAATVHSPEGLNDMAYNRCVGTRYCANNCPYKVRRFNFLDWHKAIDKVEDPKEKSVQEMIFNPDVSVRMRGVMEKCTYCVQRIQEKKILAKTEGRRAIRDQEIVTACQQTCPSDAIVFGDINNPESQVSKLRKQERSYKLLEDLNTKPRTLFMARLRNPNPELAPAGAGTTGEKHHG